MSIQYTFSILSCLLLGLLFSNNKSIAQSDPSIRILDSITLNHQSTSICGELHTYPVDVKAKFLLDSLKSRGIDTMLFYRERLAAGGYGKVLYYQGGVIKQFRIDFISHVPVVGIKKIQFSILKEDSVFKFYFGKGIDSVLSNPEKKEVWISHDISHFVYTDINGKTKCFDISGALLYDNPMHLRCQLIKKLTLDSHIFFKELDNFD